MVEDDKKSILFVCIENSSRSQMAEAFAKKLGLNALSAGTFPAAHINPLVVQAMKEKGIDVALNTPKRLTAEMAEQAGMVVLTDSSLRDSLDAKLMKMMKKKLVQWNIADPQGLSLEEIRYVRDDVERYVSTLLMNKRER